MDDPVPKLSTTSFKVAMEACRRGGDPREALSVLARMKLEGYTPDLVGGMVLFCLLTLALWD